MSYKRVVSPEFSKDLKHGILSPLLSRVKEDDTLMLALRDGYINIYYRGGNLLKVVEQKKTGWNYSASFDKKYFNNIVPPLTFPFLVQNEAKARELVDVFPALKYSMDRYFSQHRKAEREFQQLVARENNCSPISNETEYFIVDIEVAGVVPNARFDMLAVRWLRHERKKQGSLVPVLIEMKYGSKALDGTSGLNEHMKDAHCLRADSDDRWRDLQKGLEDQINQLDDLGLLNFNRSQTVKRLKIDGTATPELIFLLANYNPASTKLSKFLDELKEPTAVGKGFDLLFFVSSFAGYGMHRACMLGLSEFKTMVSKLFKSIQQSGSI